VIDGADPVVLCDISDYYFLLGDYAAEIPGVNFYFLIIFFEPEKLLQRFQHMEILIDLFVGGVFFRFCRPR
jgi:hypothetical protein